MKNLTKKSLSLDGCMVMAAAAIQKAEELKIAIAITFVDESAVFKAFFRMDNSSLVTVHASREKAITAISMGIPSGESWYSIIKDDPILFHGVQQLKDFILLGGGSPVIDGNDVIGTIGISGGHYRQDEECVKEAINAYNMY
jgi:uncharacterized protein GlcG (DUF336 family)